MLFKNGGRECRKPTWLGQGSLLFRLITFATVAGSKVKVHTGSGTQREEKRENEREKELLSETFLLRELEPTTSRE